MYRDEPLDDEAELIAIVGEDAVAALHDAGELTGEDPVPAAIDVLRLLQGWADDDTAGRWFHGRQRRLGDRSPLDALAAGASDEVEDAARAWVAANG